MQSNSTIEVKNISLGDLKTAGNQRGCNKPRRLTKAEKGKIMARIFTEQHLAWKEKRNQNQTL